MISYNTDGVRMPKIKKRETTAWIKAVAATFGRKVGEIGYMFVSDEKILEVNREYTGLAPLEYQTSLRIRRACHLLSSSDLPIAQIAAETGFDTPAYFARYFRKRLNMSPSEYRMAHKDSSDLQTIRPSGHQ